MNQENESLINQQQQQQQQQQDLKKAFQQKQQRARFVFGHKQMILHKSFIFVMLWLMLIKYVRYYTNNISDIRQQLEPGLFSDIIFQKFGVKTFRYKQDLQWESYRSNLVILIAVAFVYWLWVYCNRHFQMFILKKRLMPSYFQSFNGSIYIFSLAVLLFSFRADIVMYLGVLLIWWWIVQAMIKIRDRKKKQNKEKDKIGWNLYVKQVNKAYKIIMFSIMLITLYLNEKYDHFRQASSWFSDQWVPEYLGFLKIQYRAIHCSQLLNMTFLRLISYGIDRLHEQDQSWQEKQAKLRKIKLTQCQSCYKKELKFEKINQPKDVQVYFCTQGRDHVTYSKQHSLKSYLNYVLFTPTLLTGPPTSFNSYKSFQQYPARPLKMGALAYHIFLILSFQLYQHLFPVIPPNPSMDVIQMEICSLFSLIFIWFKYLIIWRTAKIWALAYGVQVVDNMGKCICNNYGSQGFWRMWHRGFNQWLIRYLYIPLGGRNNLVLAVPTVVAFVAFWHDHTLSIILWAAAIVVCLLPQLVIKNYFRKHYKHLYPVTWFKYVCAFAASLYIYLMIFSNLIGFGGYGTDDIQKLVYKLIQNWKQFVFSIIVLMSAVMIMFQNRDKQSGNKNY